MNLISNSPSLMNAHSYLEALLPEALQHLKQLVGINSFTSNPAGIDANAAQIVEWFAPLGFQPEWVPSENASYGKHLFLTLGPVDAPTVCLVSHLDTVYSEEEERLQQFHWFEAPQQGKIYGPGTVDIKGGTVGIWMLMKAIAAFEPELLNTHRWLIAFNASEEVRCEDFEVLVKKRASSLTRAVLVFEGGPQHQGIEYLVTSRKGRRELRITAQGQSAHAGSAIEEGKNAIVALAHLTTRLASLDQHFSQLTLNVAQVQGGGTTNRVPHEAVLELEMRAFEDPILEDAILSIRHLARDVSHDTKVHFDIEITGVSPGWASTEGTSRLFVLWKQVGESLGLEVAYQERGGMSDANYLHDLGPTLDGLGPSGGNAHCSQNDPDRGIEPEFLVPDTLLLRTHWNFQALLRYLGK